MDANGILQILIFIVLVVALTPLIGRFMAQVFQGEKTILSPVLGPVERVIYKLCGVAPEREQHWTAYALSALAFSLLGVLLLYGLQRLQGLLPLNPAGMGAVAPDLALNTAVSFVTNTNWQNYGGESTMSYLTQMVGLNVQNFVSAATGIAAAVALIRAFARRQTRTVGNFWVDLTRTTLYVLLPICFVGALVLVWQGVPQNLNTYTEVTTLEGGTQVIAQGPVASQMMIKHLGTNGGGFFNTNAAHPFENPTTLTNLITLVSIFLIGAGLTNTFGRMVGDQRQGWAVLGAMGVLFVIGITIAYWAEGQANPAITALGVDGLNMEGKEVRFGIALSALFAVVTTATSCGAVNTMHDSLMPLAGMVPLGNIMLGEVIIGGVGSGLYGMLVFVVVTMFIAGLMVGRTPEYLGKKIEAKEVKLAVIAILAPVVGILGMGAVAMALPLATASIAAPGPHGLSEVLYAYTSAAGNNGSAFGGLTGNTLFFNTTMAASMLIGRFIVLIPALAIAGSLAGKKIVPPSAGTFPTHGPLFIALLVGVIVIVGGLTYFPVLALGPIVEHLMLASGQLAAGEAGLSYVGEASGALGALVGTLL